jgi:hypothetical protein
MKNASKWKTLYDLFQSKFGFEREILYFSCSLLMRGRFDFRLNSSIWKALSRNNSSTLSRCLTKKNFHQLLCVVAYLPRNQKISECEVEHWTCHNESLNKLICKSGMNIFIPLFCANWDYTILTKSHCVQQHFNS